MQFYKAASLRVICDVVTKSLRLSHFDGKEISTTWNHCLAAYLYGLLFHISFVIYFSL